MKRFRSDWRRTLVHPISKIFVSAVGELSGRGRRRRAQVKEGNLAAVRAECDRLQQDMQELVQYTDSEINHLKQTIEHLRYERDALQMQVWLLEEQIEHSSLTPRTGSMTSADDSAVAIAPNAPNDLPLSDDLDLTGLNALEFDSNASSTLPLNLQPNPNAASTSSSEALIDPPSPTHANLDGADAEQHLPSSSSNHPQEEAIVPDAFSDSLIDLSGLRLALIGGHPSTRRGVIQELQLNYGLRHVVEIPRMTESNTNRSKVKSKIRRCTLVVLITGYMSHRLTEIVFSLKDAGSLAGDVLQLNCRGKSGVVREILNHVAQAQG